MSSFVQALSTRDGDSDKIGSGTILLIGGYGHVGSFLAHKLAMLYPNRIILAGRRLKAAQALAQALPGGVSSVEVHAEDKQSVLRASSHAALIVNCSLDQRNPILLQAAFESGAAYPDIGANSTAIASMLDLSSEAKLCGTRAVIAAGLDPGCTNIMAALAAERAGGADTIDVALLVSMGDTFGPSALNYMFESLVSPVIVERNGQRQVFEAYRQQAGYYY